MKDICPNCGYSPQRVVKTVLNPKRDIQMCNLCQRITFDPTSSR